MKGKTTVFTQISPGVFARVEVQVIEEPLPTPNERPTLRQPTLEEFARVASKLNARDYTFTLPFPV